MMLSIPQGGPYQERWTDLDQPDPVHPTFRTHSRPILRVESIPYVLSERLDICVVATSRTPLDKSLPLPRWCQACVLRVQQGDHPTAHRRSDYDRRTPSVIQP